MAENVLPKQVVDEAMNNEASMGFSTVLASYDNNYWFFYHSFIILVSYFKNRNIKPTQTCAQAFKLNYVTC